MLQVDEPDDYVLATGVGLTVREFLEISFSHAGLSWEEHVRSTGATCARRGRRPCRGRLESGRQAGVEAAIDGREVACLHGRCRHRGARVRRHTWIDKVSLPSWTTA